jgi:hypothetical protein
VLAGGQGAGLLLVVDRADELGRVREGRVIRADQVRLTRQAAWRPGRAFRSSWTTQ